MLAKCYSGALSGVEARTVEIEVHSQVGTSQFAIVGLPDQAVKEAKDRIPTALKSSGLESGKEFDVTVNLAPADVKKEGSIYDLPIAIGLLKATGRIRNEHLEEYALVGELALSGAVRPFPAILPIVMEMRRIGIKTILVPAESSEVASCVAGISVIPIRCLRDAVDYLNGDLPITPRLVDLADLVRRDYAAEDDFADVKGQEFAKAAIEVAVAGGHNLLMIGSPGSGKTMLARRIPSVLPPLTVEEALEISRIHAVAGAAKGGGSFVTTRPFRAPHHTVSSIGLLGGGTHPVPGEVSLAHRGVLFLDEFPEFPRHALEVLRQPLEDGHVSVSRAMAAHDFPSQFMLVAAMNPCPCGYYGDPRHPCRCRQNDIIKYQSRISGPLLDRIDIQIEVPAVDPKDLPKIETGKTSAEMRERIARARQIQADRYRGQPGVHTNADAKSRDLPAICGFTAKMRDDLVRVIERLRLSARSYDKILRVSRTLADLGGSATVSFNHITEALQYRRMDSEENSFWI